MSTAPRVIVLPIHLRPTRLLEEAIGTLFAHGGFSPRHVVETADVDRNRKSSPKPKVNIGGFSSNCLERYGPGLPSGVIHYRLSKAMTTVLEGIRVRIS